MYENLYEPNCIRTHSGKYFNILQPIEAMVDINDIAHALANQCRFGGHLPEFYSVAQHCVEVYTRVSMVNKLNALMHDASEAYLIDVPRPVKLELNNYKALEDRIMGVIADKFVFKWPMPDEVKWADEEVLRLEWECLMLQRGAQIKPWKRENIVPTFLDCFKASRQTIKNLKLWK